MLASPGAPASGGGSGTPRRADRAPNTEGLTAAFTAGLTAGRSKVGRTIPNDFEERDTSLELATFGLESAGKTVQEIAPEYTPPDFAAHAAIQGAPECTFGADSGARSKDGDVPAIRIEEAIRALLAGDIEAARRLLR